MIERKFIIQGMKKIELEKYIAAHMDKAGFTGLEIVKTPLVTRIVLNVTRPGLAIGKGGQNIKQLTLAIEEKFGINNPQIEIQEIQQPELNAEAVVQKIVASIERGFSWRSIVFRTIADIQRAGAQGIELVLSGKLGGKGARKKRQRIGYGYMKKVGNQASMVEYAKGSAYPKVGAIGVKLRIIRPDIVFPDKINFTEKIRLSDYVQRKTESSAAEQHAREVQAEEKKVQETSPPEALEKKITGTEAKKKAAVPEKKTSEGEKHGKGKGSEKTPVKKVGGEEKTVEAGEGQ